MSAAILIVEDDHGFSEQWSRLLSLFLTQDLYIPHGEFTIDKAYDYKQALISLVRGDYDLVLLDHHLDVDTSGLTGIDVLQDLEKELGVNILKNRFIVLSSQGNISISNEYARYGSLAYLLKPINEEQFFITISDAWLKLQLGIAEAEWKDADAAIRLLINEGLLDPLDELSSQISKQQEQNEALQQLNEILLQKLKETGERSEQLRVYEEWDEGIKKLAPSSFSDIYPALKSFDKTKAFMGDIEHAFKINPRIFMQLYAYLLRIDRNSFAAERGGRRKLFGTHWEHRVGREYRLYFRDGDDRKILERFAHRRDQPEILKYLRSKTPEVIDFQDLHADADA